MIIRAAASTLGVKSVASVVGGDEEREPSKEAARSGLMARIKHPADVFSDACSLWNHG